MGQAKNDETEIDRQMGAAVSRTNAFLQAAKLLIKDDAAALPGNEGDA
jgi:hypothetical protein